MFPQISIKKCKNNVNMYKVYDNKYENENIELIFKCFEDEDTYGKIVRGKGILQNSEQNWYKFDYVENEIQEENYYKEDIGAICIIGYKLNKKNILNLFD